MASIVSVNRTGKFPLTDDELILLIVEAFEQAGMKAVAGSIAGSHVNNHKVIVRSSSSVKRSDAFMPDAGFRQSLAEDPRRQHPLHHHLPLNTRSP